MKNEVAETSSFTIFPCLNKAREVFVAVTKTMPEFRFDYRC